MITQTTEAPRANRDGHPCPTWCTQDHDELVIPSKPEHGYVTGHYSDPLTGDARIPVKVSQSPFADAKARVIAESAYAGTCLSLTSAQAEGLAKLLGQTYEWTDVEQLISELRAAAAIARDTQ
jgi:hypothetical protein